MAEEKVPVRKEQEREAEHTARSRGLIPFEDIERMFDDLASRRWLRPFSWDLPSWGRLSPFEGRLPKVDVIDREDQIVVHAELPGVRKEDLDVSVSENRLTIKASAKHETKEEKGEYYRRERSEGVFSRTISLPSGVDDSKAKATFNEGLLELVFPKLTTAKRQRIKVD